MKTLALLCLALTLPFTAAANPVPAEFVAHDAVLVYVGDPGPAKAVGYQRGSDAEYIGNQGAPKYLRNGSLILGFKLPELRGAVSNVTFVVTKTGHSSPKFDWAAQLYVFAPDVDPRTLGRDDPGAVHYADKAPDSRASVRLLDDKFITQRTRKGPVAVDLAKLFVKGGPLADFYGADGKPRTRDGMIWFRLNQGSKPGAIIERIRVNPSIGDAKSPKLLFTLR